MKEQFKTLGLIVGVLLIGWFSFTAYVVVYDLRRALTGQCAVVQEDALAQAVEEELTKLKVAEAKEEVVEE